MNNYQKYLRYRMIFIFFIFISCGQLYAQIEGEYKLLYEKTEQGMSSMQEGTVLDTFIMNNPVFFLLLFDSDFSWKEVLPSKIVLNQSSMEIFNNNGLLENTLPYTPNKINDTMFNLTIKNNETFTFRQFENYYLLNYQGFKLFLEKVE